MLGNPDDNINHIDNKILNMMLNIVTKLNDSETKTTDDIKGNQK